MTTPRSNAATPAATPGIARALRRTGRALALTLGLGLALTTAALGCSRPQGSDANARCAECGMLLSLSKGWGGDTVTPSGQTVRFDTPKCLLRWRASHEDRGADHARLTEYYTSELAPLSRLTLVEGSDVLGPMGADLVPVEGRASVEAFLRDHGGKALAPAEVTAATLAALK